MPRFVLPLVAFVLVAGAVAYWLVAGGEGPGEISVAPAHVTTPAPATSIAPLASGDVAPVRAAEQGEEPAPLFGPPPRYVAALGGLIGRVVEPDGTPVPDMRVELLGAVRDAVMPPLETWFADEPPLFDPTLDVTTTDGDGRFRFDAVRIGAFLFLGVGLDGPRAKVQFVDHAPNSGETVDLGDVVLEPYAIFTGRLVDERRAPVAGARARATNLPALVFSFGAHRLARDALVTFQEPPSDHWRVFPLPPSFTRLIERFPVPSARTDADGAFRLEGVPLGLASVLCDEARDASGAALVPLVHGPVPTGAAGGERDLGTLRVATGETLTGVVLDEAGQPVAGAHVFAGPLLQMAPAAILTHAAITGADGRFSASGFEDADHVVAARKDVGSEFVVVSGVAPGYDDVELRLGRDESLTVVAFDPAGGAVKEPRLVIQPIGQFPLHPLLVPPVPLQARTHPQQDGSVVVSGLERRRYSVLAKADGFAAGRGEADLSEGPARVTLVLEQEHAVDVTVAAAGSGEPIEYALASALAGGDDASDDLRMIPVVTRRTDAAGSARLSGLKAGAWTVRVEHPGYAVAQLVVTVPGPPAFVELRQGGALEGVVRAGGEPLDEERFIGVGQDKEMEFPRFDVTDAEGRFRVSHLVPGEHRVAVMRRFATKPMGDFMGGGGFQSMMPERFERVTIVEGETTTLEIDLLGELADGPTARLRGRVLLNGAPAAGLNLMVRPEELGRRNRRATRTDEFGAYDFGVVPAGALWVSVLQPEGSVRMFGGGELAGRRIELEANAAAEADFDLRTGGVRGRVLEAGTGAPVVAARVVLRRNEADADRGQAVTMSENDGTFAIDLLPAGTYAITVRREPYADGFVAEVRVPFGGTAPPIEMRLERGVVARGTITLPEGTAPPRWMFVEFRSPEPGAAGEVRRAGGRVDPKSGAFEVDGLWPGKYDVRIYADGMELAEQSVDVPAGGSEHVDLYPEIAESTESP